ncbi:MAG: S8 family serine peptidase [Clostridiales Family XIII bacterium]|jgi:subtilisin family serine protease|nr:S8 family serine peptidase [Clostridiales Family XIII bacterium]
MHKKSRMRIGVLVILLAFMTCFSTIVPAAAAEPAGGEAVSGAEDTAPAEEAAPDPADDPLTPEDPGDGEDALLPEDPGDDEYILLPEDPGEDEDALTPEDPVDDEDVLPPAAEDALLPEVGGALVPNAEEDASGLVLTAEMRQEKIELSAEGIAEGLLALEANRDYVDHIVLYLTESEAEAQKVADAYQGILLSFSYGVAEIKVAKSTQEVVALAADTDNNWPAVYPSYIYSLAYEGEDVQAADIQTLFEQDRLSQDEIDALNAENEFPDEEEPEYDGISLFSAKPNDPYFNKQWFHNTIGTLDAWSYAQGAGVVVATIDSGIAKSHPDLKKNIKGAYVTAKHATHGVSDNAGHGTHVAGIIAATANNKIGVAGVAPKAKIMSIKALDLFWDPWSGSIQVGGDTADIVRAVKMAISKKANVINMSIGGIGYDAAFNKSIQNAYKAGITVVVAAGNETRNLNYYAIYPAKYKNVICVSATGRYDYIAFYSNYGYPYITIAAPGGSGRENADSIYSTYLSSKYRYYDGTSMATPVVSGVAALVLSSSSLLKSSRTKETVNTVRDILTKTATPAGSSEYYGAGIVNAAAAVGYIAGSPVAKPTFDVKTKSTLASTNNAGSVTLRVTSTTPGVKYYYTLDGKTPTLKSKTSSSGKLTIVTIGKKSVTVKVRAVIPKTGRSSAVATAKYTLKTRVSSISVKSKNGNTGVVIGKKITLQTKVKPSKPSKSGLAWTSSDKKIATVDKKGVVTAKRKGHVTITASATDGSGVTGKIELDVTPLTRSLKLDSKNMTLSKSAKNYPRTGDIVVTPSPAGALSGAANFTYKSSNAKVAKVSARGKVTAVGAGKATITVTAKDGSKKNVKLSVQVKK